MRLEKNLSKLDSFIGDNGITLLYLFRENISPPAVPDLLIGKSHREKLLFRNGLN